MKAILTTLTFLLLFAGAAMATTPDGSTPAEEEACNLAGLTGAAWGLCNAFCEAMDCECFDDPSCVPSASQNACDKVEERYISKANGVPLPCDVSCPCVDQWADPSWNAIVNEELGVITGCSASLVTNGEDFASVDIDTAYDEGSCQYGTISTDGTGVVISSFSLTVAEAETCAALLPACP